MYLKTRTMTSTNDYSQLKTALDSVDSVIIGAGAGLSVSAGFDYSGERFQKYFADFYKKYGFTDMYSGGFYPFDTLEEHWAYWARYVDINRYAGIPKPVYQELLELIKDKDYFVITTNVDHCFQKAGFDKKRLFYTQGDYGLFQCSVPCHNKTYDNKEIIKSMLASEKNMKIPSALIPKCPLCGSPMTMNLRCDDRFVQDEGWYAAANRYEDFVNKHKNSKLLFWELGVGGNTPVIIKYPFWKMTLDNPNALYACINNGEAAVPREIANRSICINKDIGVVLKEIKKIF